ncbi:Glycosyltransferase involved in cell wall bisynthesis [Micromonospora rhizosphaerae]|uniref:Glycosyltransferase involved in cell wall bisynthesis n=1 Tax=Micromonospora rhizosphaerae TaxID=568872 RepID=A0A1C6S3C8_9ACTN|nr:glycosyltransferase [Micromonospora rhizosphaerae]SCL24000.1 Glycosyltransferase involved in cell wall bisynthesis [Micromonospora rhizosphaerae]
MQSDPETPPRMLLVSYHFPPSDTVGTRRPAALAAFALQQGWDVRVLTAFPVEEGEASTRIPEERVVRALPAPPLPRFKGTSGAGPDSTAARPAMGTLRLAGVRRTAFRWIRRAGTELLVPDTQVNWVRPAIRGFLRRHDGWRPDVIVASGPPFSGFVVAAALARRLGAPWVADYRDPWSADEYWVRSALRRAVDRRIEKRVLRSVAVCVAVSEPIAEGLRGTFGVDAHVIMNGIDRRPVHVTAASVGARSDSDIADRAAPTLTLAYTGYIYPRKYDPGPLLDAIALLGPDAARVHVVFAGEDHGLVRAAVERAGVAESVTILGPVSVEKSWRIQADADALVLLLWNDPRDVGTMTGKIYDYLLARRPILLLGYEGGVAAKLLHERGAGLVCNDPQAIAAHLREWLAVKERTGRIPATPSSALDGLFREDQLARFLEILRGVVVRHAPARRSDKDGG